MEKMRQEWIGKVYKQARLWVGKCESVMGVRVVGWRGAGCGSMSRGGAGWRDGCTPSKRSDGRSK